MSHYSDEQIAELKFPELAKVKTDRDILRLDDLMMLRVDNPHLHKIGKDESWKRIELCFRYWALKSPGFRQFLRNLLETDPMFFKKANFAPTDTILRDSRELEALGFFEREVEPVKQMVVFPESQ
jgi:hypothetical protein